MSDGARCGPCLDAEHPKRIAELTAELERAQRQLGESQVALEKSRHFNRKIVDEICACDHDNNIVKEPCEMHKQWLEAALRESQQVIAKQREELLTKAEAMGAMADHDARLIAELESALGESRKKVEAMRVIINSVNPYSTHREHGGDWQECCFCGEGWGPKQHADTCPWLLAKDVGKTG